MRETALQAAGIVLTLLYGSFVGWVYATAPRNLEDVATGARVVAGRYTIDAARFAAGLDLFRREQYRAAREEWVRADPARRDARTQFYLAYAFYREGWGRLGNDAALYRQGLETARRAQELSPDPLRVDDPDLKMHAPSELIAELEQGLVGGFSDLAPSRVLRERK